MQFVAPTFCAIGGYDYGAGGFDYLAIAHRIITEHAADKIKDSLALAIRGKTPG
jgi:hypothetical protein